MSQIKKEKIMEGKLSKGKSKEIPKVIFSFSPIPFSINLQFHDL